MSSRVRNSEFRRDVKEETLPRTDGREINYWPGKDHHSKFRGGNPSKWSEVEPNNASKPADCSRWSTRESSPGDSNVKMDETIKDIRHILPIDTAFHGRGRLHNSRPFDDSLSQALRVRGNIRNRSRDRDGSRSRSRNRNQNQNQSRSRSRSRSRGRVKAKGMGRSRSRSRSRSWDRGGGGSQGRSRSPYFDERHHPIESADRPSGPRLSSRVCRDFAMGHCRRGNQCRFLHQEGVNSEGGKRSDDIAEQSSIRPEYGGSSRYSDNRTSADHTRDKVSDRSRRYNGEEEPVRDSIICCKEFLKGRCRWGASCRYPHHVTSGDNYNKSHRNDSYNHDSKVPPDISGKVPCMYFPSGKCHREDCKFSHDALTSGGYDARSRDDRLNQKLDEKSKPWTGPTWDEATPGLSNNVHHSAQPDNSFQNLISRDSAANENSADDMSRSWKGPTWGDASASNLSHIAKPSGQPDSSVQKLNSHDSAANEECHDDKNKSWNGPTWDEVAAPDLSDIVKSSGRGNISPRNLNLCDSVSTGNCSDMKKSWNGPTWDGSSAPVLSDLNKSVEWGDRSVGNLQSHDPVTIEQQSGARGDHGREKRRDGPPWNDKIAERNEYFSSHQQGATNDRYMGANEFKGTKNFVGDEDTQLVSDGSRSQTLGGVCMPTNEKNIMIDASGRELASLVLQSQASEISRIQQLHRHEQDNHTIFDDSNVLDVEMVSEETTYSALTPRQVFTQGGHGLHPPSNLGGFDQNRHTLSLNPSNGPNVDLSGSAQDLFHLLNQQNQTRIYQNEASETQKVLDIGVPQVMPELSETVVSSNQVAQITDLPAILTQISQNGQLPQLFAALNPNGAKGLVQSLPTSASVMPPVNPMVVLPNLDTKSEEQYDQARESMETRKLDSNYEPPGFLSSSIGKENEVPHERLSLLSASVPSSTNLHASSASGEEHHKSPKSKQHESDAKGAVNDKNVAEKRKLEHGNIQAGNADARGNVEESNISNDEKAMRLFKIALVEFVKEILKPTWKEGRMSREVHKTIVKKVVDKVTSTLQGNQIPKTQEKIEHYMAFSKSKITKLVEAYVERSLKPVDA